MRTIKQEMTFIKSLCSLSDTGLYDTFFNFTDNLKIRSYCLELHFVDFMYDIYSAPNVYRNISLCSIYRNINYRIFGQYFEAAHQNNNNKNNNNNDNKNIPY